MDADNSAMTEQMPLTLLFGKRFTSAGENVQSGSLYMLDI